MRALDGKADKEVTERWLENSMSLQMEMQTLHVRTQTLGQGLKVALGWVEGIADRITGLDAAERRLQKDVITIRNDAERFEKSVGNPKEWFEHFKSILAQQQAHRHDLAATSPRARHELPRPRPTRHPAPSRQSSRRARREPNSSEW